MGRYLKVYPGLVCDEGFKSEFIDEGALEYLSSLFSFVCITWSDEMAKNEEFHKEGWGDCGSELSCGGSWKESVSVDSV